MDRMHVWMIPFCAGCVFAIGIYCAEDPVEKIKQQIKKSEEDINTKSEAVKKQKEKIDQQKKKVNELLDSTRDKIKKLWEEAEKKPEVYDDLVKNAAKNNEEFNKIMKEQKLGYGKWFLSMLKNAYYGPQVKIFDVNVEGVEIVHYISMNSLEQALISWYKIGVLDGRALLRWLLSNLYVSKEYAKTSDDSFPEYTLATAWIKQFDIGNKKPTFVKLDILSEEEPKTIYYTDVKEEDKPKITNASTKDAKKHEIKKIGDMQDFWIALGWTLADIKTEEQGGIKVKKVSGAILDALQTLNCFRAGTENFDPTNIFYPKIKNAREDLEKAKDELEQARKELKSLESEVSTAQNVLSKLKDDLHEEENKKKETEKLKAEKALLDFAGVLAQVRA